MRILLINKFYFENGGADAHVLDLERLLTAHGHEVAVFAMAHPRNRPSRWSKFFVSRVDFDRVRADWQGLCAAGRMLFSFEARRKLTALLRTFRPDVAHAHNIYHQLSPSILPVLRAHGVPVAMTLHDYALVSENYTLFAHGGICEHGKDGNAFSWIAHRCIKHSFRASTLAAMAATLHRALHLYERNVDVFLAPSTFLLDTVRAWRPGIRNIEHLPNFVDVPADSPTSPGSRVLFVGRLAAEKGVDVLLRAVAGTPLFLDVVGTGPDEQRLRSLAKMLGAMNVRFRGRLDGSVLADAFQLARCVAIPSIWYENFPNVALEAAAAGRAAVASAIGGLPEQVRDGETGLLVPSGDADALRRALLTLHTQPERAARLGRAAHAFVQQFHPERFYARIMTVYASLRHQTKDQ